MSHAEILSSEHGPALPHRIGRMREPHVKHIDGRLWEIRLSGRDGIARAFHSTESGMRFVVVKIFAKDTED